MSYNLDMNRYAAISKEGLEGNKNIAVYAIHRYTSYE
jgi:hypothetical protein